MTTLIDIAAPALTFLLLTCVGIDLTRADLVEVWRRPRLVLAGLFGPVLLLPPTALAVVALVDPPPAVTMGLLLVAACPIGGISNTYSLLARADTALSVTLTGLSCAAAGITIPAIAFVFERGHGRPLGFAAPTGVLVSQLLIVLVAPVALGMAFRWRAEASAMRWARPLRATSLVLLGVLVVLVMVASPAIPGGMAGIVYVSAIFMALSFAVGWLTAILVRAPASAGFTLAAEFATRNMGVATFIAVTLLRKVEFAAFASVYLLTEIPLALLAAAVFRRRVRGSDGRTVPRV